MVEVVISQMVINVMRAPNKSLVESYPGLIDV